jgi:hypothetical protein
MDGFPLGLLSRSDVYTLIEHISIDMYDPQTHIQSCWLDITYVQSCYVLPCSLAHGLFCFLLCL